MDAARPAYGPGPEAVPRLQGLRGRCGGPLLQRSHARGTDKGASTKRASMAQAPLGQRSNADLAALCRHRMGEDPNFAVTADRAAATATDSQRWAPDCKGRRRRRNDGCGTPAETL
ncbi:hypothetical protein HPB52_018567 [Rhipicephalus sanguineus]|uniref:Uncharacterized protein n=1 Tax=Rhipicephalus sanguineus TaxID=34632 RepID=A0A9D4PXD7_RHISA|nr:hypothetical protein HPB52_018567 [Rhipicephalus sanguineus]